MKIFELKFDKHDRSSAEVRSATAGIVYLTVSRAQLDTSIRRPDLRRCIAADKMLHGPSDSDAVFYLLFSSIFNQNNWDFYSNLFSEQIQKNIYLLIAVSEERLSERERESLLFLCSFILCKIR